MISWLRHNRYPLLLALILVVFEAGLWWLSASSAGPDRFWIGATVQNPSDQFVYLTGIEQIRTGAWGMHNLYAPGPQFPYWHPFYVVVGLLARATGMSSIAAHEVSRLVVAFIAIFLIHAISRRLTKNEKTAAAATTLIALTGGCGWLTFLMKNFGALIANNSVIPDVSGEAFLFPTWLMGAHVALSCALLAYVMWAAWQSVMIDQPFKKSLGGWLAVTVLGLIHPYSLLTVAIYLGLLIGWRLVTTKRLPLSRLWPYAVGACVSVIPHVLAQVLNPSRQFLLLANDLNLKPWYLWLLAALPWLVFILMRWRWKLRLLPQERWLVIWILAAVIAILLPFKWDRKLTEDMGAILVWLSLPALVIFYQRFLKASYLAVFAFILFVSLSPIALIRIQTDWSRGVTGQADVLYASHDLVRAWSFIRESLPSDALILAEDGLLGTQTPAFAQRHVWYGHQQETPHWREKRDLLIKLLTDMPTDEVRALLRREQISVVLNFYPNKTARWQEILDRSNWQAVSFGTVTVYWRINPSANLLTFQP